jgi:hypothetical protein
MDMLATSSTHQSHIRQAILRSLWPRGLELVEIESRDEFGWLIEHMTHEAHRARDHWDSWGAIEKAFGEYWIG